ncbi:MAG: class I SAM-dependent methyltransferase, partial [Myxococcota bacterium]
MQTLSESVGPSALQMDCPSCGAQFQPWKCGACGHVVALDGGVPRFAPDVPAADDGYDPNYFERMAAVEPEHFWFRNRNALLSWALRRFFPSADNLLEIGCGTGFVLSGLSQSKPKLALYGSELHVRGLDFARRRLPDAQFFQMDARQLPFRSAFDVVGAFDVLEHIDEDQMVLEQLHEAVRPG